MTIFEEKREKIFGTRKVKEIFAEINLDRQFWFFEEAFKQNEE